MKILSKILVFSLATLAFASCQKHYTASFSPSQSAYHGSANTSAKNDEVKEVEVLEKETIKTEDQHLNVSDEAVTPKTNKVAQLKELKNKLAEVSPTLVSEPTKVSKKDVIKEIRNMKKMAKAAKANSTNKSSDHNNSVFLIVLVLILLFILIPGLWHIALIAALIWLLLYLLGVI